MKMNNYKIIEDRAELTTEQVMAGMSFGMIQKNVPAPKSSFFNVLIVSGIGVAVIVSVIFIYNSFSNKPVIKKEAPVINDSAEIPTQDRNDSSDTLIVKEKIKEIQLNNLTHADKNRQAIKYIETNNFKYYQPKRCVILLPSYCCYCIPGTSKFATSIDSGGIQIKYIECESLNQIKDVSCIWLTFITKENSYLKLEHQLNNFALLKGKDKEVHPFAFKISEDAKLYLPDFKGKTMIARYNKEINLLLFFKDTKAKVGDKIRINKLIASITK